MKSFQLTTLCAAIALGFSVPAWATDNSEKPTAVQLAPVTVIADGEEQIEATGGMVVTRED